MARWTRGRPPKPSRRNPRPQRTFSGRHSECLGIAAQFFFAPNRSLDDLFSRSRCERRSCAHARLTLGGCDLEANLREHGHSAQYACQVCGRYTHLYTWKQLHRLLNLLHWPDVELTPRYNVAPTQPAPVVRLDEQGERSGFMLKWGLIPSWAEDPTIGSRIINARGETVFDKPAFRKAAMERRCLVPISGFYEWQAIKGERTKRPHWIGRADREPLCLAGLWESWMDRTANEVQPVETFTILTTSPNALMRPLHDRMPVILNQQGWETWLNPASERPALESLVCPYHGSDLIAYPVGRGVNSPGRDDSGLLEPVSELPSAPDLFQ